MVSQYSRRVRRTLILVTLVAAIGLGAILLTRAGTDPVLSFHHDVPADLRALAEETWDDFLQAHPARLGCVSPVMLEAAWELDNRAEYRPGTATLTVRVPGTPATLRSELIHEFAHHLEFTCPEHVDLRPQFMRAQGFPAEATWYEGDTWETTPSEQYAEATVELITGRRAHRGGVVLTAEAIDVVSKWGLGS